MVTGTAAAVAENVYVITKLLAIVFLLIDVTKLAAVVVMVTLPAEVAREGACNCTFKVAPVGILEFMLPVMIRTTVVVVRL